MRCMSYILLNYRTFLEAAPEGAGVEPQQWAAQRHRELYLVDGPPRARQQPVRERPVPTKQGPPSENERDGEMEREREREREMSREADKE